MSNMRRRTSSLSVLLTVLKLVMSQYDTCYPNEIFTDYVNLCNTCEIRGYCPDYSSPGCDCVQGLFRNSQGFCVPPEACNTPYKAINPYGPSVNYSKRVPSVIKCTGPNEEFKSCGSSCPPACEKYTTLCTQQCVSGCFCTEGYVRNKNGVCVRPDQCENVSTGKPSCGLNEEYTDCGTPCPPTCRNRFASCALQCVKGCFCKRGYVRKSGRCVSPIECDNLRPLMADPQCGTNEVYSECGTACPPACENPGPRPCTTQCVRGCFCRSGYLRQNGRCVLPQECAVISGRRGFKQGSYDPRPPSSVKYPTYSTAPPIPVYTTRKPTTTTRYTPVNTNGCPNRFLCNRYCREVRKQQVGFCVGPNFKTCRCWG